MPALGFNYNNSIFFKKLFFFKRNQSVPHGPNFNNNGKRSIMETINNYYYEETGMSSLENCIVFADNNSQILQQPMDVNFLNTIMEKWGFS